MDTILYFFRDKLVGTHYFIYAFILLYLMFALIGYLLKEKYAKYIIMLAGGQEDAMKRKKEKEEQAKQEALKNGEGDKENVKNKVNALLQNKKVEEKSKVVEKTPIKEPINTTPTPSVKNNVVQSTLNAKPEKIEIPKPIPNTDVDKKIVPKPIPNKEVKKEVATPINNTQTEPNLSGTIPDL